MPPQKGTFVPKRPGPGDQTSVINSPTYSDGDALHRPDKPNYTPQDTGKYMQTIAHKWMTEEAGGAQPGITYTLAGLPRGYALFGRPRVSDPTHTDRWLYGHPSHKLFDSPNRFYPHWKFLLNHGSGESCECILCGSKPANKKARRLVNRGCSSSPSPAAQPAAPKLRGPLPFQKGPVDEEGTPDVYALLFTLLENEKKLKRKIEEPLSLDWMAGKPLVDAFAGSIPMQASFLPRHGEVVFYLRPISSPLELRQDPESSRLRMYDPRTDSYEESPPQWLAGIVTQVPATPPTVSSLDPSSTSTNSNSNGTSSQPALNVSGYRISPLPSVNSSNKLLLRQHTYTPLHLIRPFSLQKHVLAGIPPSLLHESITNALTASATISLIDRHKFTGTWPTASIHSRGIFIGPEAYWLGDTVLLLPENPSSGGLVTEIMRIEDIVTTFYWLKHSATDPTIVTGNDCKRISIEIHGKVYTTDPARSARQPAIPIKNATPAMQAYGEWYNLDHQGDVWAAPFPRILSRLYEKEAQFAWLPHTTAHLNSSFLSLPKDSILLARHFAAQTDHRILNAALTFDINIRGGTTRKSWFWAEYRAEALDLRTLAGMEVGRYDEERRVGEWRRVLGVLDGRVDRVGSGGGGGGGGVDGGVGNGNGGADGSARSEGGNEKEEMSELSNKENGNRESNEGDELADGDGGNEGSR